MSQEFKNEEKESRKRKRIDYFGRRQIEVSLLRTVLERAHMQKSVAMSEEFKSEDEGDIIYDSIYGTVSEEIIVVTTSINGQMTFEIEEQEPKAKKAKISDEKMFEEFFLD